MISSHVRHFGFFAMLIILSSGCGPSATTYQKYTGPEGSYKTGTGYWDTTYHDGKTHQVKFWGSESNSDEDVHQNAMYRVAEFTTEHGGDYFTIVDDTELMVSRGEIQVQDQFHQSGNYGWVTKEIMAPVSSIIFTIGNGSSIDRDHSHVAKDVLAQYASIIKRPSN